MGRPVTPEAGMLSTHKIDMSHQEMTRLLDKLEEMWEGCECCCSRLFQKEHICVGVQAMCFCSSLCDCHCSPHMTAESKGGCTAAGGCHSSSDCFITAAARQGQCMHTWFGVLQGSF